MSRDPKPGPTQPGTPWPDPDPHPNGPTGPRRAIYLYDQRRAPTKPPQTPWGKPSPGRCVAYAHLTTAGWTVRDLRTGRTNHFTTRTDAMQFVAGLAAADPVLTIGGVS